MPANSDESQPIGTVDPTPVTTEPAHQHQQLTNSEQSPAQSELTSANSSAPQRRRHVWRSAPLTIVAAAVFMVITGIGIPAAAVWAMSGGLTTFGDQPVVVLSILGVLAVLSLVYGWRLVLHPRIKIKDDEVVIFNPFRTHRIHLDDITQFRPGPDGLVIGTRDEETGAWCVQKSTGAIRAGRRTRADEVCDELWAHWDDFHRPDIGADDSVMIRFARPAEAKLLMELERSASLARLGHIFPPEEFPYPDNDVRDRWQSNLDDRHRLTMIAVTEGQPAGYACFGGQTLYHLGVSADHQRKGIGSALLEAAEDELFADASTPEIHLWVLEENQVARKFYREHGWNDAHESRTAEFPPHPTELKMVRRNPHLARRGR